MRASWIGILVLAAVLPSSSQQVVFRDVTRSSGIRFVHNNGAYGKKLLPETLGSGCAFFDYDNDGWLDILLVNGHRLDGKPSAIPATLRLYRNNRNGTFSDVTRAAKLAVSLFGMGVAIADYDNDGWEDVFVTAVGQSRLFRNTGSGTFTDVTKAAGLAGINEFSSSAAWLDYDNDGLLDLVVGNYVQWSVASDLFCTMDGTNKSYCTPESYKGESARLWRNLGGGKFQDVTRAAGLEDRSGKTLGIAILDFNSDGWLDIFLANDTQPNKLYQNTGKGRFTERGVMAGVAFSEDGVARAGMGVDAADYDRSGRASLIITNFSNQMMALYHNEGNGLFVDEAPRSEIGRRSLLTLGFACFFFDYDLDGWLDVFVANGHIENEIERIQSRVKYAQPPHVFRNTGGKFQEVTADLGPALNRPLVGRGTAYGDIDNDGDLDLLVTTNGGPAVLLRNDGSSNASLRVRLVGTKSNRSGLGATVLVTHGKDRQIQFSRSGSSYLSHSESILTFGLGPNRAADIEVRWPGGAFDRFRDVAADQTVVIKQGSGVLETRKHAARSATPSKLR